VRIPRRVFAGLPPLPTGLEAGALIVRGTTANGRRFHFQVTAAATGGSNTEQNMWVAVPDLDHLNVLAANQDPTWVAVTLRCIGGAQGRQDSKARDLSRQVRR
jgi:hypothetical protein